MLVSQQARRLSHAGSHVAEFCHCPQAEDPPCGHPTHLLTPSETGQIRDVNLNACDIALVCFGGNYLQSSC